LKRLNDSYGHLTGADAVKAVGQVIGANLPSGATACRYGGDEFAIVAIGLTAAQTSAFAVRLQAAVSDVAPVLDSRPFPAGTLSVSIGWAAAERPLEVSAAFTRLFREADAAMYENKRHFHRSLVRTLEHHTS
jgi:diguanylate cyclase (GGDEF)-like protein